MNTELLFMLGTYSIVPFWLLMILLPTWTWTKRIIGSPLIALPPTLLYVALVVPQMIPLLAILGTPTAASIAALLSTPEGATIGWFHFLAFDLMTGRWAYLDSREKAINPFIMAPVLFFIFMFGPVGFLLHLIVRAVWARRNATA